MSFENLFAGIVVHFKFDELGALTFDISLVLGLILGATVAATVAADLVRLRGAATAVGDAALDIRLTVALIADVALIAATFPVFVVAAAFFVARLTGTLIIGAAVDDMAAAATTVAADLVRLRGAAATAVVDDAAAVDDTVAVVDLVARLTGVLIADVTVAVAVIVSFAAFVDCFTVSLVLDACNFWVTPPMSKADTSFSGLASSRVEKAASRGSNRDQAAAPIDFEWRCSLPKSKKDVIDGTHRRKYVITCIL